VRINSEVTNNCGFAVDCGSCAVDETCVSGTCECVPQSDIEACGVAVCGSATNNCEAAVDCGSCAGDGICDDGVCCVPQPDLEACNGAICGEVTNNCGVPVDCGSCTEHETCASGTCECAPYIVCEAYDCGFINDGCAGQVDCGSCAFVSNWQTDKRGVSNDNQVKLPLVSSGNYSFTVYWGDGSQDTITAWDDPLRTHTYSILGTYEIAIRGQISGWSFDNAGDKEKILEIMQWGTLSFGDTCGQFRGCKNLTVSATDMPDLSETTCLGNAFEKCRSITTVPSIDNWNTSSVNDMSAMFSGAVAFNQDLSSWDTSGVNDMSRMFSGVTLSTINYDAMLIGWADQAVQSGVSFDGGNSQYTTGAAANARVSLISDHSWIILDGGQL
jgi:surface protein